MIGIRFKIRYISDEIRMEMKSLCFLAFLVSTGLADGADIFDQPVLDQSFISPFNHGADINSAFPDVAQTFTAGMSGTLAAVSVDIAFIGYGSMPLEIQIRSVIAGTPTATVLGDIVLPTGTVTLSQQIWFPQVIPITAGSQYAIVAGYTGTAPPASQYVWYGAGGADYYPGGSEAYSFNGTTWVTSFPYDGHFQTFVVPVPESSATRLLLLLGLPALALTVKSQKFKRAGH